MADRRDIARVLKEISAILQIKGENPYKSRAYDIGAQRLEGLPDIEFLALVKAKDLESLPGIGAALSEKIHEIHETGTCRYYEDLKAEYPASLVELLRLPDLGPKKVAALYKALGVDSLATLEKACLDGKLRELKGFGAKTEEKILAGLRSLSASGDRRPLHQVRPIAEELLAWVKAAPGLVRAEIAGSVRRFRETVADVDLITSAPEAGPVMDRFVAFPHVAKVIGRGNTKCSVVLGDGLQVDLRVVPDESFATALHHFTGSKAHHVRLRGLARDKGLTISEWGIEKLEGGERLTIPTEEALYETLWLAFVPPELREDTGEFERALEKKVPDLLRPDDVLGFTHAHTTWSDGKASMLEMALAARALGRKYLTITDHSQSAGYAGGLELDRLKAQWEEIARVQEKVPEVTLLKGAEVDILEDGRLDYPDDVLEQLDIVIISIHQRYKLDEDGQTKRVLKAFDNPHAHLWGHPTGRLLGKRDPAPLRMEEILDKAAKVGIAVEVNGSPERLDLSSDHARLALERGVKLMVSTDAHSTSELSNLRYAVGTARRGWATKGDVLNTLPPERFREALKSMRH